MFTIDLTDAIERAVAGMEEEISELPDAVRAAVIERAAELKGEEQAETYNRPIPTGADGQPEWERSEDWKNDQKIEVRDDESVLGPRGNSERYEERLANLSTGRDGVNRANAASEKAHARLEDELPGIVDRVIGQKMG